MEYKIRHLEIIQGIINRMAGNSFALKGWAVTLVSGIFALASKDCEKMYFLITYVPILVFWGLDSYYLKQEKTYRNLYDHVRKNNDIATDFDVNPNSKYLQTQKTCYFKCFFSLTESCFYIPLAILSAVIIIIMNN